MNFWTFADSHPVALVLIVLIIGLSVDSIVSHIAGRRQ